MVDVLKNLEGVYSKWEKRSNPRLNSSSCESADFNRTRRADFPTSRRIRRQNNYYTDALNTHSSFKASFSNINLPKNDLFSRSYLGYACQKCAPTSKASLIDETCKNLGLKNIFNVPQQNSGRKCFIRSFAHLFYVSDRRYFKYNVPTSDILSCKRIIEGVEKAESVDVESSGLNHRRRAEQCFSNLKSNISSGLLRFVAWFLLKVLKRLFKSVQVHEGQLNVLKKTEKFSKPIIYLPLHRSHMDYILITLVLYLNDIRVPLIAAGDNLNLPIFGAILRRLGAFFIKRKLEKNSKIKDYTYRAVLHSYIVESLKLGNSLEFFLEGGRSRTGKVCLPKAGLLSIVIDTYTDGGIEDAYIVPVSVSFDKIVEGNFVAEQLGYKKKKESFFGTIQNIWNTFCQDYGHVRVDFGQPIILSEYYESIQNYMPSSPNNVKFNTTLPKETMSKSHSAMSLYGSDISHEGHRQLINGMAQHIVYDASNFYCFMSTNLLSFLLLTRFREGVQLNILIEDFIKLKEDLIMKKRNLGFVGHEKDIILYAAEVLGPNLIAIDRTSFPEDIFIKPNLKTESALELSYYSASVVSAYFCQGVVATCIIAALNFDVESLSDCHSEVFLNYDTLHESCLVLSNILQFEHIFCPPCDNIETLFTEIIDDFVAQEILINKSESNNSSGTKNSVLSTYLSFEYEEMTWKSQELLVNLRNDCVQKLKFFQSVLGSYIETYWVTSIQLYKLLQMEMEEEVFYKYVHQDIKKRLEQKLLIYNESIAMEGVKNAVKLFEVWNIVEIHKEDDIKLLYLSNEFGSSDMISTVIAKIQNYRI